MERNPFAQQVAEQPKQETENQKRERQADILLRFMRVAQNIEPLHGKNIEVVSNKKLVQEWFGGDWEKPSIVTFTLKEKGTMTELTLLQTDVPDNEAVDIANGWKTYYLGPMKELLEQ